MGFTSTTSRKLSNILHSAVSQKVFPGCVLGVISESGRTVLPFGHMTYEDNARKMSEDSIFDVASITKTVPTSLLALKLVEEKKLDLDGKVSSILPGFVGKWKNEVTIRHLLTQTIDFGLTLSQMKDKTADEILQTILRCDLNRKPGTSYSYTNSTSIVLGFVIEKVTNKKLSDAALEKLFLPLSMVNTSFDTISLNKTRVVPTECDPWRGREIRGEIHDESAYILSSYRPVGSAGLFSTAGDLLNVLEMLRDKGCFHGEQLFEESLIETVMTNQLEDIGEWSGLGFEMNQQFVPAPYSKSSIGKTGFTGCLIFFSRSKRVGVVLLSNYHYPNRKKDFKKLNEVRKQVIETVLQNS